ncbi:MAG TPA: DinB family protein [Trueperaceae bacterium]|nr:DinB family protein [Trueperaceae bacterium]
MSVDVDGGRDGAGRHADVAELYTLVRRTRENVFAYAAGVPVRVLRKTHPGFRDSMLGLLAHVAECYLHWVAGVGLGREMLEMPRPVRELDDVRALFRHVDDVVEEALTGPGGLDRRVVFEDRPLSLRWLVLHPVTHEFHHKGQVASLGRILGHPVPEGVDLDLVLPD